ncbi:MAG: hypothetical protein ACYCUI_13975 [Vulcanimicrobiaceae bacterium]
MNRAEALELARLATAFADGETLRIYINLHGWTDWNPNGGIRLADPDFRWCVKPKAPEPMEFWTNVHESGTLIWYKTAEEAQQNAGPRATRVAVHFREVMP